MFKNIKNAFIWYYLYKFRKTFSLIVFLLLFTVFASFIYDDIVQYLTLRNKLEYLDYILPLKWFLVFFNLTSSFYLFFSLFKNNKKEEKEKKKKNTNIKTLNEKEKKFLKKDLSSKADLLIKRKKV